MSFAWVGTFKFTSWSINSMTSISSLSETMAMDYRIEIKAKINVWVNDLGSIPEATLHHILFSSRNIKQAQYICEAKNNRDLR